MKHLLILGATSDIAKAVAYRFAKAGYGLTLAARNPHDLATTVTDLKIRYGVSAHLVRFDATDFSSHPEFYDALPEKPDVVLCAFGYLGNQEEAQTDFFEATLIMEANYVGAVSILSVIANDFERKKSGAIIGISSVAGERGRKSNYVYGSAKAGFTAFLSGLRGRLFASGVHVLSVKPGFVRTKMVAGVPLPPVITAEPETVANDIFRAFSAKKSVLYSMWLWKYIMMIVRLLPEFIFKRLNF